MKTLRQKENLIKELLSWVLFFVFVALYVIFIVPIMRENIHKEGIFGIIGFFLGMFMMILSQVLIRTLIYPGILKIRNNLMLKKIREDRPGYVIHEVMLYYKNKFGFYDVMVDMEGYFYETKIKHTTNILPYPLSEYQKLTEEQKNEWQVTLR